MIKTSTRLLELAPIGTDILTLLSAQLLMPSFISRMMTPSGWNALLISGVFFLFVTGVYLIRRMKPAPTGVSEWLPRGGRVALALFFSVVLSLALAWQLGFFASAAQVDTTQMGEGGAASYFVFGPGAWLAFSLIYVLVFAFTVEPSIAPETGRYLVAAVVGLLTTGLMLLILVAQTRIVVAGWGFAGTFLSILVSVGLFLPPRLLYLSKVTSPGQTTTKVAAAVMVGMIALVTFLPAG